MAMGKHLAGIGYAFFQCLTGQVDNNNNNNNTTELTPPRKLRASL